MGKRFGDDLKKKILDMVITMSSEEGIANVRTTEVALRLGISETVIFTRFRTKQNLMDKAFYRANLLLPREIILTDENHRFTKDSEEKFLALCDQTLERKEDLFFVVAYLHSSYFHKEAADEAFSPIYSRFIATFQEMNPALSEEACRFLAEHYFNTWVGFMLVVAKEEFPRDSKTLLLFFRNAMFGLNGVLLGDSFEKQVIGK